MPAGPSGWWQVGPGVRVRRPDAGELAVARAAALLDGGTARLLQVLRALALDGEPSPEADLALLTLAAGEAQPADEGLPGGGWTRLVFAGTQEAQPEPAAEIERLAAMLLLLEEEEGVPAVSPAASDRARDAAPPAPVPQAGERAQPIPPTTIGSGAEPSRSRSPHLTTMEAIPAPAPARVDAHQVAPPAPPPSTIPQAPAAALRHAPSETDGARDLRTSPARAAAPVWPASPRNAAPAPRAASAALRHRRLLAAADRSMEAPPAVSGGLPAAQVPLAAAAGMVPVAPPAATRASPAEPACAPAPVTAPVTLDAPAPMSAAAPVLPALPRHAAPHLPAGPDPLSAIARALADECDLRGIDR